MRGEPRGDRAAPWREHGEARRRKRGMTEIDELDAILAQSRELLQRLQELIDRKKPPPS